MIISYLSNISRKCSITIASRSLTQIINYERKAVPNMLLRIQQRNFNRFGNPAKFKNIEKHYILKDKIPPGYTLIYKGNVDIYVMFAVTLMWMVVVVFFISSVIFYLQNGFDLTSLQKQFNDDNENNLVLFNSKYEVIAIYVLTIALATIVFRVIAKYPLRMYQRDDEYMAVFASYLPKYVKKLEFYADDITSKQKATANSNDIKLKVLDKKIYFIEDCFRTPYDLKNLQNPSKKDEDEDELY